MSTEERPSPPRGKIVLDCPDCGSWQFEPKLAVSTFCRECGVHIDLPSRGGAFSRLGRKPAAPRTKTRKVESAADKLRLRAQGSGEQEEGDVPTPQPARQGGADKARGSFSRFLGDRSTGKLAKCLECDAEQRVPSDSESSMCVSCGVHIDLRDFDIRSSTNLTICTYGKVKIHRGGALQGTKITCRELTVLDGSIKGKIRCLERFRFRGDAKVIGRIDCGEFVVDEKSTITCFQPVQTEQAEIRGDATASIICSGTIRIGPRGILRGNVVAAGVTIDEGGTLDGTTEIRRVN